jgi:hypothetical protein
VDRRYDGLAGGSARFCRGVLGITLGHSGSCRTSHVAAAVPHDELEGAWPGWRSEVDLAMWLSLAGKGLEEGCPHILALNRRVPFRPEESRAGVKSCAQRPSQRSEEHPQVFIYEVLSACSSGDRATVS